MNKVFGIVTEKILDALDRGVVPWARPWAAPGAHKNLALRPYRGVNQFLLDIVAETKGYESPYWGTFNQVKKYGGTVTKGEKGTLVIFWKPFFEEDEKTGEQKVAGRMLRYYNVFNVAQTTGMDWEAPEPVAAPDPLEEGDRIIRDMPNRPDVSIGAFDQAYYSPGADRVVLPALDQYEEAQAFYRVAFHELVHSTGHKSRLDRDLSGKFGTGPYAGEELVAEIGAAMLCAVSGVSAEVETSAAYVANWRQALSDDPQLIVQAAAKAQKAADYILGTTFED